MSKQQNTRLKNNITKVEQNGDATLTKEFKYKIGFHQSVSTGIIGLEGYVHFDDGQERSSIEYFLHALERFQKDLKDKGFTVAGNDGDNSK